MGCEGGGTRSDPGWPGSVEPVWVKVPILVHRPCGHSGGYGWAIGLNALLLCSISAALLCCRVPDWRQEAPTDDDGDSGGGHTGAAVVARSDDDSGSEGAVTTVARV